MNMIQLGNALVAFMVGAVWLDLLLMVWSTYDGRPWEVAWIILCLAVKVYFLNNTWTLKRELQELEKKTSCEL